MKKFSYISMLAIAAMAAFSCAKEIDIVEEPINSQIKFEPVVINAFADDDIAPDTKTTLNSLAVEWASTDQIAGYVDGNVEPQKSSSTSVSGDSKRATFTFGGLTVADKAKLNFLFYPALSAGNEGTGSSASKYNINLLSTQKAVANSFADDANIAIAEWNSDEDAIQFKNMGAILGISVSNDNISSIKISANEFMTGHSLLDPTPGGAAFDADAVTLTKDGNKYVILNGGLAKSTTYYAVVYPGSYTGLTIEMTRSTDGKVATFTNGNTLTVGRNDNILIANLPLLADDNAKWKSPATSFVKVESDLSADWSGDYLFVHEGRKYAYDGSKEGDALGANGDWVDVTITDKAISATDAMLESRFTIAKVTGGYSIQSASGYYIGRTTNSNGINTSTTDAYVNTIEYDAGTITITSSAGPKLQFYNTSGSYTFKYYKSSQALFSLYKLQGGGGSSPSTFGVTYDDNGASSGTAPADANSYGNQSIVTVLGQNSLVKTGYTFAGWNTKADGSGIAYNAGDKFVISGDVTLYAQWAHYTVTWLVGSTAFKTDLVLDGGKLSLPANSPDPNASGYTGYSFMGWTSAVSVNSDGTSITYAENNDDVTADITYRAVFAEGDSTPASLSAVSSSYTLTVGDELVIVADDNGDPYGMYQSSASSWVNKFEYDGLVASIAADVKTHWTVSKVGSNYYLGDSTNGYLYNSSSTNLSTDNSNKSAVIISYNSNSLWAISVNSKILTLRTDTATNKFRVLGTSGSGVELFSIYKYTPASSTYSNYTL